LRFCTVIQFFRSSKRAHPVMCSITFNLSAISNNKRISAEALGCNYLTNDPRRRFPISLHHNDVRGYFVLFACRIAFARNKVISGVKFRSLKKNSRDTLTSHELSTRLMPNYTSVLIHIIILIPHHSFPQILLCFSQNYFYYEIVKIFYCVNVWYKCALIKYKNSFRD